MHWTIWAFCLTTPLASSFLVYYLGQQAPELEDEQATTHPLAPSAETSRWFFPAAWSLLYVGFGLGLALTLRSGLDQQSSGSSTFSQRAFFATAVFMFIVNLCLNHAYLVTNFKKGDVATGRDLILANLAAAVVLVLVLASISPGAAAVLLPYAGYLFYAWRLQSHIARARAANARGDAEGSAAADIWTGADTQLSEAQ